MYESSAKASRLYVNIWNSTLDLDDKIELTQTLERMVIL